MNLRDGKILVTGGSRGIGKAIAKELSAAGARVFITGRDEKQLSKVADEIKTGSAVADQGKPEAINAAFDKAMDYLGGLNCLINNAAIGRSRSLEELSWQDFQDVYAVNVFGVALFSQKAATVFKKQNYGNIINIASTAALKGYPNGTIYSSSKFALRGMTECWRNELRPHNIRVMLINPSEVTTAFGSSDRQERAEEPKKLRGQEIAAVVKAVLEMDDRGFIPELSVWATNPW